MYLDASRRHFETLGVFRRQRITAAEAAASSARQVIFCEGHAGSHNGFFPWVKFRSARGDILTVKVPELHLDRIVSSGQWLLPLGVGVFRTGSTYDWSHLVNEPSPTGRTTLEAGLAALLEVPWNVIDHRAAVRPIISESRALIGRHPGNSRLCFFNGLGSKGSLHAPWFARCLADHLCDGRPIPRDCDVSG
jgi:glycine/D-amino acid oxidase-like deaminating enzyme